MAEAARIPYHTSTTAHLCRRHFGGTFACPSAPRPAHGTLAPVHRISAARHRAAASVRAYGHEPPRPGIASPHGRATRPPATAATAARPAVRPPTRPAGPRLVLALGRLRGVRRAARRWRLR